MVEFDVEYEEPDIDGIARALDEESIAERARLNRRTLERILLVLVVFMVALATSRSPSPTVAQSPIWECVDRARCYTKPADRGRSPTLLDRQRRTWCW